jgi:PTS system ascorbate-specific IIA component
MGFIDYVLNAGSVAARIAARDWEEAIFKGGDSLVRTGCCDERYLVAIVEKCREVGPYIVIAPGIAMPHGRPEEGAKGTGYSLVTLSKPVDFGEPDNDPVDILIFMAADSATTHVQEGVSQIADFCDNPELIDRLRACANDGEILDLLRSAELKPPTRGEASS